MSVGLIEPCFDNLHDLLKHMEVPLSPLDEAIFHSPTDVMPIFKRRQRRSMRFSW